MKSQVKVGVIIRPLLPFERDAGSESAVKVIGNSKVYVQQQQFEFDRAFSGGDGTSTQLLYDSLIKPLIDGVFDGYSATVFAYGQTGSGKTHTMGSGITAGCEATVSGIIPCTVRSIFEKKSLLEASGAVVTLDMSYLEIYKEECFDLLAEVVGGQGGQPEGLRPRLDMRDNTRGETIIEGLCSVTVGAEEDVHRLLELAARSRSTAKTAMNARSSRSHAIATFHLKIVTTSPSETGETTTLTLCSKMHLVDLAGSERVKKTQAAGDTLQEGISINQR